MIDVFAFLFQHEPWWDDRACKDADTNLFFPGPGQSKKAAINICRKCPVIKECKDYADRSGTQHGIWGGEIRNAHSGADYSVKRLSA